MPHPTIPVAVRHPETGDFIALDPARDYNPNEPSDALLIKAYPWAFAPRDTTPGLVESVKVEQATAAPGEKRNRKS